MPRFACCVLWFAGSSVALAMPPQAAPNQAACKVWQRELSFAESVQHHDMAAFAGHVAAGAVFDANTDRPTRGLAAIKQRWARMIEGKRQRIRWYPRQVVVTDDPNLAYSSGPYLFENLAPGAKTRFTIGDFATLWQRGSDGVWRALFDGGSDGKAASDTEAKAFQAGRQQHCPLAAKAG